MERTLGEILLSVLGLLGSMSVIGLMMIGVAHVLRPREHDPRMNIPQMVYSIWARWLDHKERRESLYIDAHRDSAQRVELAEPVKRGLLPEPECIEGEIVFSEAQKRAVMRFVPNRAVEVSKENKE